MSEAFTTFLIVLGAGTLAYSVVWAALRILAWVEGRPW